MSTDTPTREAFRLNDQANTLDSIIHHDTLFPKVSFVLEAGYSAGAQTKIIATKIPIQLLHSGQPKN
jgi:hypothetical protein